MPDEPSDIAGYAALVAQLRAELAAAPKIERERLASYIEENARRDALVPGWRADARVRVLPVAAGSRVTNSELVDAIEAKLGPLTGGGVLLLRGRFDEEIAAHLYQELIRGLRERGVTGPAAEHLPIVVALSEGQSIELLDEDDMRAAGWHRSPAYPVDGT